MRMFYTPDQPQIRQTLTFTAHVMDKGGEPLQKGDVIARIMSPAGKTETHAKDEKRVAKLATHGTGKTRVIGASNSTAKRIICKGGAE